MAIALASIIQESNDFSPKKTVFEDFSILTGKQIVERFDDGLTEIGGMLKVLATSAYDIAPIYSAWAVSAGRVRRTDYAHLRSEFTSRLSSVGKVDGLLLALHGAQTAIGVDDVAGDILHATRALLGPKVPIVVTLDLHANVTEKMIVNSSAIVGYQTYPHKDLVETGARAASLLLNILSGAMQPTMAFCKLPLIVPAENMQTAYGPFANLWQSAQKLQNRKSSCLEMISIFGVQPWLDVPNMGCSVVAVTNRNYAKAKKYAEDIAKEFWDARHEFDVELTPVEAAIQDALKNKSGLTVLSESSDSTGSGSPGDSTGTLAPLLKAAPSEPVAVFIVDPAAVAAAIKAGVGGSITTSIGGKIDRKYSRPVKVKGRVHLISDGRWTPMTCGYRVGVETCMGRSAVIEVGQIRLLVAERAVMTLDPELYRSQGIEPTRMRIVVVKSPNGFREAYEPIAKQLVIVDTPGVSSANLKRMPYRRVNRAIYPFNPQAKFNI